MCSKIYYVAMHCDLVCQIYGRNYKLVAFPIKETK